jgi:hypothetical protein
MAHGSSHSSHDDKSLEQGYQVDNVNINTLIKFLVGLGIFTAISLVLMYGLKWALEKQALADDAAEANPMALSERQLPPEPRLQAAPGFGVTTHDGRRIDMQNQLPQAEYWALRDDWNEVLEKGSKQKDPKTGQEVVINKPIEEAKKEFLKDAAVRAGAPEAGEYVPVDTNAGRTPGGLKKPEGAATENKEADAKPEGAAKPAASPTPAATATGASGH